MELALAGQSTDRPRTPPCDADALGSVHSLPDSKRYAETDAERSAVLARHNAVLADLFDQLEDHAPPYPLSLGWLYHPYDGGADVLAPSETARDQIAATHHEWASPYPGGT